MRTLSAALALSTALVPTALAGGSGENAVLVVDPSDPVALHVANLYANRRALPGRNVVYLPPGAADYTTFVAQNLPVFLAMLQTRGIEDHVDFVVLPPGGSFYVSAPGLVGDSCFAVSRFASASVYTLAFQAAEILGHVPSSLPNEYARPGYVPAAFDGSATWLDGVPSTASGAQRYLLGAMLGYTGTNGNTLQDVLDMIERSVAVDGTHPTGTTYYMQTNDVARSSPRHGAYPSATQAILALGQSAQHLFADLPLGSHDVLGIMTGLAAPDIDGADLTILPGAFCDHLTSFAGRFDTASQTKMSRWIAKGASGSAGTVEEPCNYPGKFPHARMHVVYRKGLTLGEAWLRSMDFAPFQNLLYGDPLTRPFADVPSVSVPGAPGGPVSGVVVLSPTATVGAGGIAQLELLVDGRVLDSQTPPAVFALDTNELTDGWHEVRVLAENDQPERSTGAWVSGLVVSNHGRATTAMVAPATGDLTTSFAVTYAVTGGTPSEVRLVQNERVVAASSAASGTLTVHGRVLGAGPVRLFAEALFEDGSVRSAPVDLDVTASAGSPSGAAPVAFGYEQRVLDEGLFVVELPATFDDPLDSASYVVLSEPPSATLVWDGAGRPFRVYRPLPGLVGTDTLTFRVDTPSGSSPPATITLRYSPAAPEPGFVACLGDGTEDPCPCGNESAIPGRGCVNSSGKGMYIVGSGSTSVSADDLSLYCGDVPLFNTGIFYSGTQRLQPMNPLFDGLQCAVGMVFRYRGLYQFEGFLTDGGFVAQDPTGTYHQPGTTYYFQCFTRDVFAPTPCGGNANLSPAYAVTLTP